MIKIAHITDLHLDEAFPTENGVQTRANFRRVLEDIKKENITDIICTGDISEEKGIQYFFEQTKSFSLAITLGNHDSFTKITDYYNTGVQQASQKLYSSTETDNMLYIYLDSSIGVIDDEQLVWLQTQLSSPKPVIIFIHHPVIGVHTKADETWPLQNRDELLAILTTHDKSVSIFCGHYHMTDESTYKNCTQYITPAVSFQLKKSNEIEIDKSVFGYRVIEIENGNISSQVKLLKADQISPFELFEKWYQAEKEITNTTTSSACCLSSFGLDGYPNSRFISLKEIRQESFVITGSMNSRKGLEIEENNKVALTFWWAETNKQIRIQGDAFKIKATEADVYFKKRSKESQIVSTLCNQGDIIDNYENLEQLVIRETNKYQNREIDRPKNWGGFSIKPVRMEFLEFKDSRLHKRTLYSKTNDIWKCSLLQP